MRKICRILPLEKKERMSRKRYPPEKIIDRLREHEAGGAAKEVCRRHGVSEQTLYRWRSKYGGIEVSGEDRR